MANHLKEREYGETQTIGIGLRKKQRKNDDDNKDSTIINPGNQREMDDVVNSGDTLQTKHNYSQTTFVPNKLSAFNRAFIGIDDGPDMDVDGSPG